MNLSNSPYSQGNAAGHEWFKRGIDGGEWEATPNPFPPDTKEAKSWEQGYEDGQWDAENAYYV